jgi:hypothetical protein
MRMTTTTTATTMTMIVIIIIIVVVVIIIIIDYYYYCFELVIMPNIFVTTLVMIPLLRVVQSEPNNPVTRT